MLRYAEEDIVFDEIEEQIFVQIEGDMLFSIDQIKELIALNSGGDCSQRGRLYQWLE